MNSAVQCLAKLARELRISRLRPEPRTAANATARKRREVRIGPAAYGLSLLVLSTLLLGPQPAAHAALANQLTDVQVTSLPGDRIEITLVLEQTAAKPRSFTIDDPARIALDLADTMNKLEQPSRTIGIGQVRSMTTVEAGGRTRVVINLAELVPYETRVRDNKIHILLEAGSTAVRATGRARTGPAGGGVRSVADVDFRRGAEGQGRVVVHLSDPSTPVDMRQEDGNIVVELLGTSLPERLERRLDVIDFATPVKTIDTFSRGDDVRMVITPTSESYEHLAYQADDVYTVEVKPITEREKEEREKKKERYTGEKLSLNFQDIEVRAVLQLLADFTGLNIVVSDSVSGSLTLRLKNVPWDQAMDIILRTKGLDMRQTGNVVLVAPAEEIAAREKLELQSQKQIEELAPLRTEWFQINYAKASDLAALIKGQQNSLLSERGNVTIDERTNTLMIQDTSAKLAEIRSLISRLDIPVRQVLIESRIVIANKDFSRDLGVKFGVSKQTSFDGNKNVYAGPSAITGTAATLSESNLIVDLGVEAASAGRIGLAVGRIGNHLLQLELSALQAEQRGEVISSPRLITANQKEALIEQGIEIPYQEATSSGATSVSFKKAVLSLKVTPQITPDDRVIMDLAVNKDSANFDPRFPVPGVDTREITTQVLVNNGETVVLGGIYEQTSEHNVNRIPFFGNLPVFGYLFRDKSITDDKSELLIFVTPKIVKEQLSTLP
ncbi:MAG: type IV pilus secretin PilQ [Gammaproteobacteria bacterium]|nr:type IV pilus secretin PilQ [Gammaproteobacteria bacterium]NIR97133.1 type IV pilus secretin PilQ [Gammaproteobacteria bacterium]NIT62831.1 type IV pilus secretin PilQ [Gammaproteobacteria bacterium]NIV19795.1 type IV pilus secretin PilQ [Gammaproteobacteria bacterium]NIX11328.1 type IV pilus secretin PilQ [Gammaproteobacteria bacterium]